MKRPAVPLLLLVAISALAWAGMKVQTSGPATPAPGGNVSTSAPADYSEAKRRAEALYAEGSYAQAHEIYAGLAAGGSVPEAERRWVRFRAADTLWRSEASTRATDTTRLEEARRELETMAAAVTRVEERDALWAEIQESLGDFWWWRPEMRNWSMAWAHYQQALDWWAGSDDLETARERYLGIVRRTARPPNAEPWFTYGYYGNQLPVEVIENALRIARAPADVAHMQYMLAMTLRSGGADKRTHRRTREAFEAAIAAGRRTPWYDDALYNYAAWNAQMGRLAREGNAWVTRPDYAEALRLYRKLVAEFPKGESRHHDEAVQHIEEITKPAVSVSVSNVFFPGSEIQYHLGWRNLAKVDLALYPIDLVNDARPDAPDADSGRWLDGIATGGRKAVRRWTHVTPPDERAGEHAPGSAALHLDEPLPPGAYLFEARGGNQTARDLVLVTAASLVVKTAPTKVVLYVADARDGAPRPGAAVALWVRRFERRSGDWRGSRFEGRADDSGLASFDLPPSEHGVEILAAARHGDDQTIAQSGNRWWGGASEGESWKVYATTDRPAYRPEETVKWKAIARRQGPAGYVTPGGETILYEITDPRGAKVAAASLALNVFGSAWAEVALTSTMPLGEYQVVFKQKDGAGIGVATLFRLEEYKRPEFQVAVTPPEENGRPKVFRAGETIEADIVASYYFGGPVAGATAEVVVQQRPYWIAWHPEREYAWLYQDAAESMRSRPWHGGGQVVHRETLRTDADGKARVRFQTPSGSEHQDFEYAIEARVTDASRREINGQGSVRVSRQLYHVFARADHNIHAPGDEVRVTLKAMDANERPVAEATGRATVTRERWIEIWVDPEGREVSGDELARTRKEARPRGPGWRPRFRGYKSETILERSLSTGSEGEAEVVFTAQREGYYKVAWASEEKDDFPVRGETSVWVADRSATDLGYHHHGGVGIIVDEDTFHEGRKGPVMLTARTAGSYVLFSVEADDLLEYRLVHMTGTAKLIELGITARHVPNIFLEAALVQDGGVHIDSREVIVPPERNFLKVELVSDKDEYQPRETGVYTVTTRDHQGRPVPAEVELGLIDASVLYIQKEYAPDPREFFFGQKRMKRVHVSSSFDQRRYADLVVGEDGALIDRRAAAMLEAGMKEDRDALHDFERGEQLAKLKSLGYVAQEMAADMAAGSARDTGLRLRQDAGNILPASAPAEGKGIAGGLPEDAAVVVRTDFRATAFWQPDVVTGEDGSATVSVTFPDALTTWKGSARAASSGSQFGQDAAESRTSKPLIARLQAPRFFVVGDQVTLSAVINNNTDSDLRVRATLDAAGLEAVGDARPLVVPAGGEARADWQATVTKTGLARLRVTARADAFSDAMEQSLPVYEHGIEKLLTRAGTLRGEEAIVKLDLPAARRPGSTSLTVRVAPSLAVTMLDALPYLIDYPYGCTEQTMSRFLPAVVVARTLEDLGLKPEEIASRVFGGIETAHAEAAHPDGKKDLAKLDDMVRKGLDRLYDFQHDDGGWGWWKDGESDHFMTAYVVWGLGLARDAGVNVRDGALGRGVAFLDKEIVEQEENPDIQAFMLHAISSVTKGGSDTRWRQAAFDNLWSRRDRLNAYTRALLALAAHHFGDAERARTLVRNLANGVKRDDAPDASVLLKGSQGRAAETMGTAHWGEDGLWWRWSEGGVEATAFALRALLAIDPGNALVEPVTAWLIRNRRGAQWSNTRDTAMVVLAMTDYLRASGELASDLDYTIDVNGRRIAQRRIGPKDILSAPSGFVVDPALIRDGANEIRIARRGGSGRLYFATEAMFFSTEEPVTAAGSGLFIRRNLYKQVGRPTLLKGTIYHDEPLADGGTVTSGERVDVVLTIEAKNHYEYIVLEDLKAAGLEAVAVRSGESIQAREIRASAHGRDPASRESQDYTGRSRWVHQELRDRKVALFLDKLPEGIWEIRYELRAEVPGSFHALPALGHAMYVPEIRGNGEEIRVTVQDRPDLSGR